MKLYSNAYAPNPRRVRMFLAEKGVELDVVEIDIGKRENLSPEFLAINPLGWLPVLELDDGRRLAESVAICRYFEELYPEPALLGDDAWSRAQIEQWNRHMEHEILLLMTHSFRNTHSFWEGKIEQVPEWGELSRRRVEERLDWLDRTLEGRAWIAGDRFSIADITALAAIDFGRPSKIRIKDGQTNLRRWYDAVNQRPSARA